MATTVFVNESDLYGLGGNRSLIGNNLKIIVVVDDEALSPEYQDGGSNTGLVNADKLNDGGNDSTLSSEGTQHDGGVDSV